MCDTAAEGDIERYLPIAKRSLELFLAYNLNSKYAAEMVDTIYKLQHKLSPEAAVSALSGNYVCCRLLVMLHFQIPTSLTATICTCKLSGLVTIEILLIIFVKACHNGTILAITITNQTKIKENTAVCPS